MVPIFLSQSVRKSEFNQASSGYNLLQSGKASLISDEVILKSILNIYENELLNISDRQNEMKNNIDYIQKNFVNKYFTRAPNDINIIFKEFDEVSTDLFEPIDFRTLTTNVEFQNSLIQLGKLVETRIVNLENTETKLRKAQVLFEAKLAQD